MANQLTRRQWTTLAAVSAASPFLPSVHPSTKTLKVSPPATHAVGILTLPMGLGAALEIEHFLQEMAAMGGMVSMATFNARFVARTGVQLVTEGFVAEHLMVRVTTMGAGFAVSLVGMFNVAFFISSAGLMGWIMIQERWAPQVHDLDINFVPLEDWYAMTGGDLTGTYLPGIPHNLPQAWLDLQLYLYQNPGVCSGFNAKPGQGGCFGGFGGGPGGPFDSPTPPPGWIGVGPLIIVD